MTGAEFEGVDIDLLADFVGGALDGTPDEERVAALVAGDPSWRAAFEAFAPAMAAASAALRDLEPEPMPADLAARLDGLFRSPAAGAGGTTGDVPGEAADESSASPVPAKVVDLGRARRARRWAAPLTVAAASLAVAGFGLNGLLTDSADNRPAAGQADTAAAPLAAAPPIGEILHSGTDYSDTTLTEQRSTAFSGDEGVESNASSAAKADPLGRLADPTALAVCLDAIAQENAGGPITVEFVDYARFEGRPALVVRFSATNGGWVWAAGPECGTPASDPDTVRKLPVR
ncbi:hypothetical protein [Actinoplanes utahensis]|uniref:Anti-sigma factor n=1 Tax=Actinoplanes utahensis TaxID=1869 RepID=A0A0A6UED5_ACTUT|nr:hypothetical protein [Actinoplanes utahensis]KHD74390.1 hypothetical protein MB27_29060 [Actinoplanes utahensis]GIF31010.1 hypothetical protein Aut01nite_39960 [Actinoplanes utahensis]